MTRNTCVTAIVLSAVSAARCASRPTSGLSSSEVSALINGPLVEPPAVSGSWAMEPAAYRGIQWCTSEGALNQVVKPWGCGDMEEPSARHRYCSTGGEFSATPVREVYEFKNDHLVSVSIEFPSQTPEQVISLLVRTFGEPTRRFRNVINRGTKFEFELEDLRWDGKVSTLSFQHVASGNAGKVPGGPVVGLSTEKCGGQS
jgi:hypothetical protein